MNQTRTPKPRVGPRTSKSVTLQDVAQRAGVHVMTISHALKGTGRMTTATRESICRIAGELNYKPNRAARALVTGRTGAVAVVTGPVSEHFYAHVVHLLERELAASQTQIIFACSRQPEREMECCARNCKRAPRSHHDSLCLRFLRQLKAYQAARKTATASRPMRT